MEGRLVGYGREDLLRFVGMSEGIEMETLVAEFDCDCSSSKEYSSY